MGDFDLYAVNWQDGMLISREHLKDQERYFENLVRWYAGGTDDRYGLVRKPFSGNEALRLSHTVSGNSIRVEISECHALMPDGGIVAIDGASRNAVSGETIIGESAIPVYLGVSRTARKQVGEPDPQEDVPRVPYLVNEYSLHLGEQPDLPETGFLQLANLQVIGDDVQPDEGYYPPCLSLHALDRLADKNRDYRNRLENLLSLTSRAYAAVSTGGSLSEVKSDLQVAFKDTIYLFGYHLSAALDDFVVGRNAKHPLELVVFFKKLFRVMTTLLNYQPGMKDYLNERFFTKEANTDVGQFLSSVDGFLFSEYNHRDLGGHIRSIDEISAVVHGLFSYLAQIGPITPDVAATETITYQGKTYNMVPYSDYRCEEAGGLVYLLLNIPAPQAINDLVVLLNKALFGMSEWNSMQVRLGLNQARSLGETDPVNVDTVTLGNKVAFRAQDMVRTPSVNQVNLIFRGAPDINKFEGLGKTDLAVYAV